MAVDLPNEDRAGKKKKKKKKTNQTKKKTKKLLQRQGVLVAASPYRHPKTPLSWAPPWHHPPPDRATTASKGGKATFQDPWGDCRLELHHESISGKLQLNTIECKNAPRVGFANICVKLLTWNTFARSAQTCHLHRSCQTGLH